MKAVILMATVGLLNALHCDKDYNFDERGYDITCQHLSKDHLDILQNITVNNEISLTIENSALDNVTPKLFQNVRQIRSLLIEDSNFTFSPLEHIFETLPNLEHLLLKNTTFHMNEYTFLGMAQLKELVLSRNGLKSIEEGALKNLEGLVHFQLTENSLEDTSNIALCDMKNLKSLNLSTNLITNVEPFFTLCESPSNAMDFSVNSHPYAVNVPKEDYTIYDFASELEDFDMSYNRLTQLGDLFDTFKYVKVVKLQGNQLSQLNNSNFQSLEDLRELYLQNNNITLIQDKVFDKKHNLERMDLSHNSFSILSIKDLPMLRYLNLGSNKLKADSLDGLNITKSLQKLLLGDNDISEVKAHFFREFVSLELLDLNNNHLSLNTFSFNGLVELKTLLLAGNNIEVLPELVFSDLKKLKTLDLSRNKLKVLSPDSFKELKNLNVLNISHNYLQGLEYSLLEPVRNLHILDIADNDLSYIQYDLIISNLPSLSVLNIKENRLSCEFLVKIVGYLRHKEINYTMQQNIDSIQENVAGIFCTNEQIEDSLKIDSSVGRASPLFNASMVLITILLVFVSGVVGFKFYVYLKRRKYRADEFELIRE